MFVDLPIDFVFVAPDAGGPAAGAAARHRTRRILPATRRLDRAAELLRGAERPVVMAGTDIYWGRGEHALLELAQTLGARCT